MSPVYAVEPSPRGAGWTVVRYNRPGGIGEWIDWRLTKRGACRSAKRRSRAKAQEQHIAYQNGERIS